MPLSSFTFLLLSNIFLVGYGFSMFMKNPNKRVVLKTRLFFMIILGIATGYLYLLDSLKEMCIRDRFLLL